MPDLWGTSRQQHDLKALWGPYYEAALDILGSTAVILPFGDTDHGKVDAQTFATIGEIQAAFTWREVATASDLTAFDTPLDLTMDSSYQGLIPKVTFNGTDEVADTPDADYWSRAGVPFSVGAWVNMTDSTSSAILSRLDLTTSSELQEWLFFLNSSDEVQLQVYDDSAAGANAMFRPSAAAVSQGVWTHVAATKNGDDSAATDINLYINGAASNGSGSKGANYTAMENIVTTTRLGYFEGTDGAPTNLFDGQLAGGPLGPFFTQTELSADAILRLYQLQRRLLGV